MRFSTFPFISIVYVLIIIAVIVKQKKLKGKNNTLSKVLLAYGRNPQNIISKNVATEDNKLIINIPKADSNQRYGEKGDISK